MKKPRVFTHIAGIMIIIIGLSILFSALGVSDLGPRIVVPFIFLLIGFRLLSKGRRIFGAFLLLVGFINFLNLIGYLLNIHMGRLIGLSFSAFIIYVGYRMMRRKKKEIQFTPGLPFPPAGLKRPVRSRVEPANSQPEAARNSEAPRGSLKKEHEQQVAPEGDSGGASFTSFSLDSPQTKHSLIGNLFLTGSRWDLQDMNIWHGIGDVKIDLSRAYIHEGETVLFINGWVGDIDIYVPYDLNITLTANVNLGDIDVFGNKQGGFNRSTTLSTSGYKTATKKVRIIVSLLIGDIDVMYL
ncbi:cell wall-active antibiotics response protein LiaF [Aneurinibacillus sp. Ricciae_BoGa-3]|uniref:cell wall-active antibiotics response protein LiaF n=1 Tax=Aneurinibacillus sp. Ricciae_BoGa-3 TaxID=3022697 RepID=UPI002341AAB3|nr:cell wall-active antibiotics response protein LiaF [Aneurinibacillus sp. Ricciae_BoGa-3]WCK55713.1 cell wall-active antibiotics response protein LiaF [Aneurinibacillus sp. Ricciae_BoGa-3]